MTMVSMSMSRRQLGQGSSTAGPENGSSPYSGSGSGSRGYHHSEEAEQELLVSLSQDGYDCDYDYDGIFYMQQQQQQQQGGMIGDGHGASSSPSSSLLVLSSPPINISTLFAHHQHHRDEQQQQQQQQEANFHINANADDFQAVLINDTNIVSFEGTTGGGSSRNDANNNENNQYDQFLHSMLFAAAAASSNESSLGGGGGGGGGGENFPNYLSTPTHTTTGNNSDAISLILTPRSPMSRTYSPAAENSWDSSSASQQGGHQIGSSASWNGSPVLYGASSWLNVVDPAALVLRTQNDLFDLGGSIPRVLPNPYEHANDAEPDIIEYRAFLTDSIVPSQQVSSATHALGSQTPRTDQEGIDGGDPWNSEAAHDSPYHGPGYSNFLPPYGPMSRYKMQKEPRLLRSVDRARQVERTRLARRGKQRLHATEEPAQLLGQYEHSYRDPIDGSMRTQREGVEVKEEVPRGRRHGPLLPETAVHAGEVRRVGACWRCRRMRVKCDTIGICKRCIKHAQSKHLAPRICCYRQEVTDFCKGFFPDLMVAHLHKREVQNLINENVRRFTDDTFEVEITSGSNHKPFRLLVCMFESRTDELLMQDQMRSSQLVRQGSAPLGLVPGNDPGDLLDPLSAHVQSMIDSSSYAQQTQTTEISQMMLEIVRTYRSRGPPKSELLEQALKLHAIHHFMGRIISFTPTSARNVMARFGWQDEIEQFFSSRLLNRQIKSAMNVLHQQLNAEVLDALNAELKSTSPQESWAISFSTIVVLCLCMEEFQIAVAGFTALGMTLPNGSRKAAEIGREICRHLDFTLETFTHIFHEVHYTHKKTKNNPVLDDREACAKLDDNAIAMMVEVRRVIETHRKSMEQLKEPVFDDFTFPPAGINLSIRNPGRLLSAFLLSFLSAKK